MIVVDFFHRQRKPERDIDYLYPEVKITFTYCWYQKLPNYHEVLDGNLLLGNVASRIPTYVSLGFWRKHNCKIVEAGCFV
jgi:hypothetical protein